MSWQISTVSPFTRSSRKDHNVSTRNSIVNHWLGNLLGHCYSWIPPRFFDSAAGLGLWNHRALALVLGIPGFPCSGSGFCIMRITKLSQIFGGTGRVLVRRQDLLDYMNGYHHNTDRGRCKADRAPWPCEVYTALRSALDADDHAC